MSVSVLVSAVSVPLVASCNAVAIDEFAVVAPVAVALHDIATAAAAAQPDAAAHFVREAVVLGNVAVAATALFVVHAVFANVPLLTSPLIDSFSVCHY